MVADHTTTTVGYDDGLDNFRRYHSERNTRSMCANNGPELTDKQLKAKRISEDEEDQDAREAKRRFYKSRYYRLACFGNGQEWIKARLLLPAMIEQGAELSELVIAAKDVIQGQGKPITDAAVRAVVRKGFNDFHSVTLDDLARGLAPSRMTAKIEARTACDWWLAGRNEEPEPIRPPDDQAPLDAASLRAARFLDAEPAPFQWLLKDGFPLGMVSALAAAPGSGKTFALLQLGMAVATGRPFVPGFELAPEGRGKALLVLAEESEAVIHHRLWGLTGALVAENDDALPIMDKIRDNLLIVTRAGQDSRLVRPGRAGEPEQTAFYAELAKLCREIGPELRLVAIDPWSQCAPLAEKAPRSGGKKPSSLDLLCADEVRGSSALIGAVRAALMLAPLMSHEQRLAANPNRCHDTILAAVVKANHGRPPEPALWQRGEAGSLALFRPLAEEEVSDAMEEAAVMDRVRSILRKSELNYTAREFARTFCARIEWRGDTIAESRLRAIIDRAVADGLLLATAERYPKLQLPAHIAEEPSTDWMGEAVNQ